MNILNQKIKWFLIGFFSCVFLFAMLLWWGWPPDEPFWEKENKYNRPYHKDPEDFSDYYVI